MFLVGENFPINSFGSGFKKSPAPPLQSLKKSARAQLRAPAPPTRKTTHSHPGYPAVIFHDRPHLDHAATPRDGVDIFGLLRCKRVERCRPHPVGWPKWPSEEPPLPRPPHSYPAVILAHFISAPGLPGGWCHPPLSSSVNHIPKAILHARPTRLSSPPKKKKEKLTTARIRWWSPTQLLTRRSEVCVWQSGRDAQFSSVCGRKCKLLAHRKP
jgi:hypothetical protein